MSAVLTEVEAFTELLIAELFTGPQFKAHRSDMRNLARQRAQQCIEARNQQGDAVDAVRYRHLRAAATFGGRDTFDLRWYLPRFGQGDMRERLDAAIDAAIEQRKADKKGNV